MKLRLGHVPNSSSSSFIVAFRADNTKKFIKDNWDTTCEAYVHDVNNSLYGTKIPKLEMLRVCNIIEEDLTKLAAGEDLYNEEVPFYNCILTLLSNSKSIIKSIETEACMGCVTNIVDEKSLRKIIKILTNNTTLTDLDGGVSLCSKKLKN